jgi:outer membrane protein assembly factor BamB
MLNRRLMGFVLGLLVCRLSLSSSAANWPQFRGPNASGVDSSRPAVTEWNVAKGKNVLWKTPIPGLAHASPIVWGDRAFVVTAVSPSKAELKVGLYGDIAPANDQEEHQWRLLAINRDSGKTVWDKLGHKSIPRVKRHTKASHANSTPATDGQRIVAIFGSEGLFCFDTKGELVWKKDLGPMDSGFFRSPSAQWGFASSPIIHEGKVLVQCDVQTNSFLAAFELTNGKELWRTTRKDVPTWSTPNVAEVGGQKIVLANGWHQIAGYEFKTGAEIWTLDGGGDIPVPTPIFADGLAYFTSAHGSSRPMRAIRVDAKGDITPPSVGETNAAIVWAHARSGNYMQTPILVGDYLYGCQDNGVLTCFEAKTGKIHFSERLAPGNEGFSASPVSDGQRLYFASENGNVFVVPATNQFSISTTNKLGEICMASPALVNGALYFRTRDHLIAIGD